MNETKEIVLTDNYVVSKILKESKARYAIWKRAEGLLWVEL